MEMVKKGTIVKLQFSEEHDEDFAVFEVVKDIPNIDVMMQEMFDKEFADGKDFTNNDYYCAQQFPEWANEHYGNCFVIVDGNTKYNTEFSWR